MGNVGSTPLHKAANEKNLAELRWAVQKHPQAVNAQEGQMGWTPLHIAAYKGSDPIVRELLARGAKPDLQDKEGRTALHLAALQGFEQVARDLLRRNASTAIRDKTGAAAYDYAALKYPAIAFLLGPPPPQPATAAPAVQAPAGSTLQQQLSGQSSGDAGSASSAASLGSGAAAPQAAAAAAAAAAPTPGAALARYAPAPPVPAPYAAAPPNAPLAPYAYAPAAATAAPPYYQQRPAQPAHQPFVPAASLLPYPSFPAQPAHPAAPPAAAAPAAPPPPPPAAAPAPAIHVPTLGPVAGARPYSPPSNYAPETASYPPAPPTGPAGRPVSPPEPVAGPAAAAGAAGSGGGATAASRSSRPSVPTAEADLDWGAPAANDWGGEEDLSDAPGAAPPPSAPSAAGANTRNRPGFNPIQSARYQLERLLGAGLSQLHIGPFDKRDTGGGGGGGGNSSGHGALPPPLPPPPQQQLPPMPASPHTPGAAFSGASAASTAPSHASLASPSSGRLYRYEELAAATGNFSPINKLGEGGFGPVYRGALDGIPVAIKVMDNSEGAMQGRAEFEAEVSILSRLHHPHVVLLIGSCPEKGILVYELMGNSSLAVHLFAGRTPSGRAPVPLGWRDRVRIAAEVASALLFLHSATTPIVHMDLKPDNILLDEHKTAKLGDVGLARLIPALERPAGVAASAVFAGGGRSCVQDSRIVGTWQYLDPEYQRTGEFSPRSDVYSFGMVLLQLLTGLESAQVVTVVQTARGTLNFAQCIDPRAGDWPAAEAIAFADLGLKCVEFRRQDRPDLRSVILPTLQQLRQRTLLYEQADARPAPQAAPGSAGGPTPPMFMCPITQDIMQEPVVAADGYSYERLAIQEWIRRSPTSPLTNMSLAHTHLTDNLTLRSAIKEYLEALELSQRRPQAAAAGAAAGAAPPQPVAVAPPPPSAPPLPRAYADAGGW